MRSVIATLAVLLALLTVGPARADQGPADPELDRFVYEAVLDGLTSLGLSDATVDRILEEDSAGRPVSFIPGCPICMPAREAFRAYRQRTHARDVVPTAPAAMLAALDSEKDLERTSALGRLMQDWIARRIAAANWSDAEAASWARRFEVAAAEGQRQLTAHQAQNVEAYKMMWSCMICDGASRACKRR